MRSFFLSLTLALFSSCTKEERPSYLAPPTYQTFHPKTGGGAFFQIKAAGKFYLASSIHQGGAKPKAQLFRKGQKDPVILTKKFHAQKDLHLWKYDPATLSEEDALTFHPDVEIKKGDRIFILNKGQKIAATVMAIPEAIPDAKAKKFRHTYKTDEPFPAGGMSGSPIFLPRTGSVIGVLQTANHRKAAKFGGFEQITLP